VAASRRFFAAALKVSRRGSGITAAMWSRARLSMALMRFFGFRASEAALLSVANLKGLQKGIADLVVVKQPKTEEYRSLLVTKDLLTALRGPLSADLSRLALVHKANLDSPLGASVKGRSLGHPMGKRDWVRSLNNYLEYVCTKLGQSPRITTHCFRINYVTALLSMPVDYPLAKVMHMVGHKTSTVTERYYRYSPDPDECIKLNKALRGAPSRTTMMVGGFRPARKKSRPKGKVCVLQ
jgi:integrase